MRYFYWYLYVSLWLFALIAPNIKIKAQKRLLALYCAAWAIIFGFRRDDVGNDTPGYTAFFENIGTGKTYGTIDNPDETLENGFLAISHLINLFTDSSTLVFLLIGIGVWGAVYLLYERLSDTPLLSLLFMMTITGKMFYTLGIAVRQTMSIILILYGFIFIIKSGINSCRDILKSKWSLLGLLLLVLSVTVHRTTGIMTLVLLVLYFLKMSKPIAYLMIFTATGIAIFAAPVIGEMFDGFLSIVGAFSDETINLLGDRYMGDMTSFDYSGGAMLGWTVPALLTTYLTKKEMVNSFFYKIYIFSLCLNHVIQFSSMHIRLTPLFILLGFVMSVPSICRNNRLWYNFYLLIALFYLYLDYQMFARWDVDFDTAVPYYFLWQ